MCPLNGNSPMTGNTIASAARCQMNNPYDQRPSVTIAVLPSSRCEVSGRSSTSGAINAAASTAPIAIFTTRCQPFGACQRRSGHQERHRHDHRHQHSPPGQPVRPADFREGELCQQHARREPREERGRPGLRVDTERRIERDQHPCETGDRHGGDHGDAGTHRQSSRQQSKERQRQVEGDLDGKAPHLGQPGGQSERYIDLGQ